MNKLSIKNNRFHIKGDVSQIDSTYIVGFKLNPTMESATFDFDITALDNLCKQIKVTADENIKKWYIHTNNKRNNSNKILNGEYTLDCTNLNKELKPFQKQAIAFANETQNSIIGYDMGLGKTLISINYIKSLNAKKVLVVCPTYLKYSWENEIIKWDNVIKSQVVDGNPKQREKQIQDFKNNNKNVLIINYEQIKVKISKTKKILSVNIHDYIKDNIWDLIIWDEAHRLKTRDSQNSLGALYLKSMNKLMLTGTPATKNPTEIWSLLRILDRDRFRSFWSFSSYYCKIEEGFRGVEIGNLIKPQQYKDLLDLYMIRKLKQDVAKDLPPKIYKELLVTMSPKQKKYYDKALIDFLKPDDEIIGSDIERFIRLNQISMCPAILEGGENISITRDTTLELIEDIADQIIVSCTFINMSIILEKSINKQYKNRNTYLINSTISIRKRHAVIEAFKKDRTGIMITTIKCLSEGANLDCCDTLIMTDIEWNCGTNKQHQNRIHRMTSTNIKTYFFILVTGTVHHYKYKKIEKERIYAESALKDSKENIKKFMVNYKEHLDNDKNRI